ncbi:hypothetical protein, conserved [Babesia bigemina]|uniref:GYF domain-containing protein n=1 Tax=Babesia bigemina TaxID=5866 RepID=A0A061D1H0_BABBI|nr:hypothetical protein, conserved [Babesia bigemina]CDR93967.1 hypothetical protein, conserved [Babesia bigemina]|eukprot:XP_012766153.1 hypothetical protein, conserved [Babesia bigemina]
MFHPRPFGGIAGIFAKSARSDPTSRSDGSAGHVPDGEAAVIDAPVPQRSVSLHRNVPSEDSVKGFQRLLEARRSIDEPRASADTKVFTELKLAADLKSFGERRPFTSSKPMAEHRRFPDFRQPPESKPLADIAALTEFLQSHTSVTVTPAASRSEPPKPQLKLEIPADAEQKAASEAIYDKLYLLHLMFNIQRISTEQGISVVDSAAPKLKFLPSHSFTQHSAGARDTVHGHREGLMGLYAQTAQSLFDQGEGGPKSMHIASGQRRSYFDQRIPKGKESFLLGREGYDLSDYPKRGDLHDGDSHFTDGPPRWKTYESNPMRSESKFGFDRFKGSDGLGLLDGEPDFHLKGLEHFKPRASPFASSAGTSGLHGAAEMSMQSLLQEQSQQDRFDMSEHYPQFDGGQVDTDALLLGLERHTMHRPSADVHFNNSMMMSDPYSTVESADQKLLQYTALAASAAQAQPTGGRTSDSSPWPSSTASDMKTSIKADDVFSSPLLKSSSNSISFLERLLDKSFDNSDAALESSIAEATAQFQKSLQLSAEQHLHSQPRREVQTQLQSHLILQSHLQSELQAQMHGRHGHSHGSLNMHHKLKSHIPLKSQHHLRSHLPSKTQQLKSHQPSKLHQLKLQSHKLQPLKSQPPSKLQLPLKIQPPLKSHPQIKPPMGPKSQTPLPFQMQSPSSLHASLHLTMHPQLPLQLQPQPNQPIPKTIDLQWQYMDFHGLVHGPFSSKQMYTWYINNFFNPNLKMRYNQSMQWTPFRELYPVTSRAFVENPVGYSPETPSTTTQQQAPETPNVVVTAPTTENSEEPVAAEAEAPTNESPQISSHRWNKPDELKVDSLLDIMEKQKLQSAPKEAPKAAASPDVPKPSPGWKVADSVAEPSPVASEDFPSLALGVEKATKPRKKLTGTPSQQGSTMTLKAFMKHQAQAPDNSRVQPRESFASKLMGNNK